MATLIAKALRVWVQNEFSNVGQDLQRGAGDYAESTGLIYDHDLRRLVPAPAFVEKGGIGSNREQLMGAFWSADEGQLYVTMRQTAAAYTIHNRYAPPSLGAGDGLTYVGTELWAHSGEFPMGVHGQYSVSLLNYRYMILGAPHLASHGYIYEKDLTTTFDRKVGSVDNFLAITLYAGEVVAIREDGALYRVTGSPTVLTLVLAAPAGGYQVGKMFPHQDGLVVVASDGDGRIHILHIDDLDAAIWREVSVIGDDSPDSVMKSGSPVPFSANRVTVFDNRIYILRGFEQSNRRVLWSIHKINTSFGVDIVATFERDLEDAANFDDIIASIHGWRNQLVCVVSNDVYLMVGKRFAKWATVSQEVFTSSTLNTFSYSTGGYLLLMGKRLSDGGETFWYADPTTYITGGEVTTSRLAMDAPGNRKFLHAITVLLDAEVEDGGHLTAVYYRINDDSAWTTLTAGQAGNFLRFDEIKAEFYLLQIRVVLNNGTTGRTGISEISAAFTTS